MPREPIRYIQNSFNSGELTPRLHVADDFDKYKNGVSEMLNWLPLPHGGATVRAGLRFVNEVKDSTKTTILIRFQFSNVQAYIIEVGDLYMRFYRDGGAILDMGVPFEIVTPYTQVDLADLRFAQSADVMFIVHPDHAPRKLSRLSDTNWTLTVVDFTDGPYLEMNTDAAKTLTVSANTGSALTMTATGHSPFQSDHVGSIWRIKAVTNWGYVKVTGFTSSTSVTVDVTKDLDFATPGTDQTADWREGAWSDVRGFPRAITIFEQRSVYASNAAKPQTLWGSSLISLEDMTPTELDGVVTDKEAFTFTIGSNEVNVIQWLASAIVLFAGTTGEEFTLTGGNDEVITPTNILARSETAHGSANVQGLRHGSGVLFVPTHGRKIRFSQFSIDRDGFVATDISIFAEHLLRKNKATLLARAPEPNDTILIRRDDGVVLLVTHLPEEQVVAFSRLVTDGTFESIAVIPSVDLTFDQPWFIVKRTVDGATKQYVEFWDPTLKVDSALSFDGKQSGATLTPSATTGTSVVFTASAATFAAGDVGKHLILIDFEDGGQTWNSRAEIKTFVSTTEVVCDILNDWPSTNPIPAGSWFIGVSQVSGLDHLVGETVKIIGDGAVFPDQVVNVSGEVDLVDGTPAAQIDVGLSFGPTRLKTLPPAVRDQDGTIRHKRIRWAKVFVALEDTNGLTIQGRTMPFRRPEHLMDRGIPLFTGDREVSNLGWDKQGRILFEQNQPLPATVLALTGQIDYED